MCQPKYKSVDHNIDEPYVVLLPLLGLAQTPNLKLFMS